MDNNKTTNPDINATKYDSDSNLMGPWHQFTETLISAFSYNSMWVSTSSYTALSVAYTITILGKLNLKDKRIQGC